MCVCVGGGGQIHGIDAAHSFISFLLKLIHGLGFYDDLNFLQNVCNRSSCRKF